MRIQWTTQNEASDDDGVLLQDEASFRAEMEWLRLHRCPDTEQATFIGFEVVGRDESITTAEVTDAMARWLFNETDAEEVEQADVLTDPNYQTEEPAEPDDGNN
jgi:hypothetical protein